MEFSVADSTALETSIDIVEEPTVEGEPFTETIEISHNVNITVDNNKDPLDFFIETDDKYPIRPCYIHVERCDKIWETMKLIRELQEPHSNDSLDHYYDDDDNEDDDDDAEEEDEDEAADEEEEEEEETTDSPLNDEESNSSSSQANPMIPYIKYQPVLGNGNTALPNFQFSVKSTRALYQCNTCGRQYSHRSTLREHSERIHNIILPMIRRPPKWKPERSDSLSKTDDKSHDNDDDESNHESGSTISSTPSEDKERLLDSASETQETEYLSPSGKIRHTGTCKHCGKVLSDKYYLKVHETLIHGLASPFPNGGGPLVLRNYVAKAPAMVTCDHCNDFFYGSEKLNEHKQIIHGIISESSTSTSAVSSSSDTSKINGRKQVAMKKPATSSVNTLSSKQTEPRSPSSQKLEPLKLKPSIASSQPIRKNKNGKIIRTCEACGKLYSNNTNWKIHLITVHGIIPPQRIAVRRTYTTNSLGIHSCKYCNKKFSYTTTLRNHVILQHIKEQISSQKPLKPQKPSQIQRKPQPVAPSSSSSSSKLRNASQPHKPPPKLTKIVPQEQEDTKPLIYSCESCSNTYCSRQSLLYHMANVHQIYQTHTRKVRPNDFNKPFACQVCHERFWGKKNLNQHELIFHGIRSCLQGRQRAVHKANKRASLCPNRFKDGKIERPPQLTPVRSLRDKERLNYDEAKLLNEKEVYKTPKTPAGSRIKKEPTSQSPSGNEEPVVQCILCNRHCKKIKKHFVEFHKVRNPEILISQCQISPLNPSPTKKESKAPLTIKKEIKAPLPIKKEIKAPLAIKKEIKAPLPIKREMKKKNIIKASQIKQEPGTLHLPMRRKRRPVDSMRQKKAMPVPGPQAPFELVLKEIMQKNRRVYACKFCRFITYGYETARKHCRLEHSGGTTAGVQQPQEDSDKKMDIKIAPVIQRRRSEGQLMGKKRRRESLDEKEIQKRRISSVFGGELRMTRAVKRLKEELEHKCENCERMFRNADILAAHKVSCKTRMTFESGMESNDTRESSDRDSGIGISITIKKKNDSYEIVSRDSSGERPSKRFNTGDGSSDASSDTRNSLNFAHEHRVVKLEKMDDEDLEVDLDAETFEEQEFETVDAVEDPPPGQILSLTDLCKRALGHTRQVPKSSKIRSNRGQGFQCRVCKGYWPSRRSRGTHCWKAHKVSATETDPVYKVESLRNLCVNVLQNHGDLEAAKKVWYPCHICNTVWPTTKSRRSHVSAHEWRKRGSS
ncbi:zinc finger protein 729 [Diachasma alloeum]|uniref:zinc finger protein 729 n=1 Tax=Diachasma alloeum TaxID=454923 RepID=UPI00073844D3|nr:zinc finger protein 729 [Diachasma alloeum]